MDERPAVERLRGALESAVTYTPDSSGLVRRHVRDAVCAFVEEMRTEGMPPEEIVVGIRAVASTVGVDYFSDLANAAVRWAIAHYFGAPLDE